MPRDRIRSVVLSAEKDAVKRFLSYVHQSWDQIQVETMQVKLFSASNLRGYGSIMCCQLFGLNRYVPKLWLSWVLFTFDQF